MMGAVRAPRVKICGITDVADAERAVEGGAWAIGLIFHEPSPRCCTVEEAVAIGRALRRRAEVCGVFFNAPLDEVVEMVDGAGLTMVQLHGDEGPAYCDAVAHRAGAKIMKAARVAGQADVQALRAFRGVDFHLLDAHRPGIPGGTGETFDWELVRHRRSRVPLVLSGGLTPSNVASAIAAVRPFAVDVASGVEAQPGRKDPAKLEAFFAAVRDSVPDALAS
jgi:phosphoribosylanthranilate isomerase